MSLLNMLKQDVERYGIPKKKERLDAGTPLKHFLRPVMEEAMRRRMEAMQNMQPPQLEGAVGGVVEPPSVSPLQNALMTSPQGGGAPKPSQGGSPYAA